MTSYSIYIFPDTTNLYSKSVLNLMKEHEYSSVIITLGNNHPFLQKHVPNAFFLKKHPLNENLIIEEITKRKPSLVVINNFSFDETEKDLYSEKVIQDGIDPLLNRVLHCSIQQKNIKIVQVVPVSSANSVVQRFGMAEKIYCSVRHMEEVESLRLGEYNYKTCIYNDKGEWVPTNKPVENLPDIEKSFAINTAFKQEFRLYQYIHTIHNRTELFLFVQHLREINRTSPQESLNQIINETCIFLDRQQDSRQSITEEDKNEYIYKISASIPHISQNHNTLLDQILAFFTDIGK